MENLEGKTNASSSPSPPPHKDIMWTDERTELRCLTWLRRFRRLLKHALRP
jgi:hypothetical protein